MHLKAVIRILLVATAVLLLIGCGGGGDEAAEAPTAAPVATAAVAQSPTEAASPPTPTLRPELPTPTADPNAVQPSDPTPTAPLPEATAEPTAVPTESPPPAVPINGMPPGSFIILDDAVRQNIRDIFAQGQAMGRNSSVFSILGDSLIATPQSLAQWDGDQYILSEEYAYLQPTIDHFTGSYGNYGASVRVGLHSWSVFDPLWADKEFCQPNEDVLACEIRLNNPAIMLIFLGSNDAGSPGGFDFNMRQVVETVIAQGIVPVLATKADRFEGPDNVNNTMIRQIAADFQVPLLEFDILADTIPGRGLSTDNVHLTYGPPDYTQPQTYQLGYPVHNLAVLMMLDELRSVLGI